ncbi:peptidoglycan editing factor PgeF [Prevotella sp. OH937_COT-195]|uniref:peptidoglycan editing factor PgeF n=1 Tax=Prevotella sp. OH937_COT-195 TaxID=2491051 RepID=UPI000F64E985|nr:peptidoglycan editing factor PgeF [Prevotella sp. OH937_COT-195]RRD02099.1 peptidoglycan editing factor PgeF [Prevotella sp. OH937_COT-195]
MTLHEYCLGDTVYAFSTMRQGGVGKGNYASFNINRYCGDSEENIARNLEILADTLNIAPLSIIYPRQVHGTVYKRITKDCISLPTAERQSMIDGSDALITDVENICIGVSTADCIPILLYDPEHHCAAAIHAGWRGTVRRMAQIAVAAMCDNFSSKPEMLRAVIGPGISLEAFEVGDEVYYEFLKERFPMEEIARRFPLMHGTADSESQTMMKWHIDLPACNRLQLIASGIPASNIYSSGICTYASCDAFFSARRLGTDSGRIFTGIILK